MVSADAHSQGEYEIDMLDPILGGMMRSMGNDSINQGSIGYLQGEDVNENNVYDTNSLQQVTENNDSTLPAMEENNINGNTTHINNVNNVNNINNVSVNNITNYNLTNYNLVQYHCVVTNNDKENLDPNVVRQTELTKSGSVKRKARVTPLGDAKVESIRVANCLNAEKNRVKKALRLSVAEDKNVMYEQQGRIKDQQIHDLEGYVKDLKNSLNRLGGKGAA
jgi:hypothetical protein